MAYDLEEQERLAELKAWWSTHGKRLLALVLILVIALAGWRAYGAWQAQQSVKAAALYSELQKALQTKDKEKISAAYRALRDSYMRSEYAGMAALWEAKYQVEQNNLDGARDSLQWAAQQARSEELRALAALRLAAVLLDQKQYDLALQAVSGSAPAAFAGLFADRRGDIYWAQNKNAQARQEFQVALEKLKPESTLRRVIEVKLEALGEG